MAAVTMVCGPWPIRWTCDILSESPTVTASALLAATEVLWALSGRQFGTCDYTFRPTREPCNEVPWVDYWPGSSQYILDTIWPFPRITCECVNGYQIILPGIVSSIVEVKIDGIVLTGASYRVDNNRILVRTDGKNWPVSNNFALIDGAVGTWSIRAIFGVDVPTSGQWALGELACEFIRALNGGDCQLPKNISSLARQGINIQFPDVATAWANGRTGLYLVDAFISAVNPHGLAQRSRTYRVDSDLSAPRRTGT